MSGDFSNFVPIFQKPMPNLNDIQQSIAPELVRLNERISRTLQSPNPLMNQIISTYLRAKGKQIRPVLTLLAARMFAPVNESALAAAASVELLHNATLIHDDVVDETKLRRGAATINGLWDNHLAVLIGDFFVSTSLQQALETGDMRIVSQIASLGRMLSVGEVDQISNAREHTLSEEAYMDVIYRKTASLFVSCVRMGAYAVGAPDAMIEPLAEYARLLGLAFQISDDIFDYITTADAIGKPTGNDLREGKITLPLLHVLRDASLPRHGDMLALACKTELTAGEIDTLVNYAVNHGGIDYSRDIMARLRDEAAAALGRLPDSESRRLFSGLFDYIIYRQN